jgi:hypothetical protein
MKTKLLSGLLITLLITACHPCRRLSRLCPPVIKDSVSYIETVKLDTLLIQIPGDTTVIEIPVSLPDYNLIEENTNQKVELSILKGRLKLRTICKEDSLEILVQELRTELSKQETITVEVEKEVIIYKSRKVFVWSFIILIILIILSGAVVFFKIKYKSLKTALNSLK